MQTLLINVVDDMRVYKLSLLQERFGELFECGCILLRFEEEHCKVLTQQRQYNIEFSSWIDVVENISNKFQLNFVSFSLFQCYESFEP